MARLQSVSAGFKIATQASLELVHKSLVTTAKREHAKIMAEEPRPSSFHRIVDGVRGAAEEAVRPDGVIVYRYPRLEQVVQFAMEALFDLSPVLSGEYRRSHVLFVNGEEVANLAGLKEGDDIAITNYLPYARKIEVGSMKMRVPGTDLVYQQARRKVMSRFRNLAVVDFTYRSIVAGVQINQAKAASNGQAWWLGDGKARAASGANEKAIARSHGKTAHNRSVNRYPALIIRER